jgi:hypothetical protein
MHMSAMKTMQLYTTTTCMIQTTQEAPLFVSSMWTINGETVTFTKRNKFFTIQLYFVTLCLSKV